MIEIKKFKLTKNIIDRIVELDKLFYVDFDYSNINWYLERYSDSNEVTTLCVNNKIVGYYILITISEKLYSDILDLKYTGDYNFPVNEINSKTNLFYNPSILVHPDFRKYSFRLIRQFKKDILNKENLVAIAISHNGKRMCEKYMQLVGCPKENVWVYKRKKALD